MFGRVKTIAGDDLPVIDGVGTYVWRVGEDVLEWSPGLAKLYGLDAAPGAELGFYALVHPEDRVRVEAETNAYLGHAAQYAHEFRIVRPDGTIRHVHDKAVIRRGPDGRIVLVHGVNIDITEQRRSDPDAGFRTLADNINQLVWIADRAGWILWYNARWFEYTGTTLDQMEGWGWKKVHHPDHVDRVVERISECFRTGEDWEDTFPLRGADGRYRWFLSRARAVRDPQGVVQSWFGTNTDITEQRERDDRVKRLRHRFEWLSNAMPQLVWTATADGAVTYYNKRLEAYWSARNGAGAFEWRNIVHHDDVERTAIEWARAVEDGVEYACEHRLRMADGSYRWHLSRAVPDLDAESGDPLWFGTATDIDALKQSEQDRELLLHELNHRIKNTLALVQSISALTLRTETNQTALGEFQQRLQALARANDLLVSDGWKEISIAEIVANTIEAMGTDRGRIEISGVELRVSGRVGLMLALAVHELATNATKYGSLSNDAGRLVVSWLKLVEDPERFHLEWREVGGPPVNPPVQEGFGSQLLKKALPATVAGETIIRYEPGGLFCLISGRVTA